MTHAAAPTPRLNDSTCAAPRNPPWLIARVHFTCVPHTRTHSSRTPGRAAPRSRLASRTCAARLTPCSPHPTAVRPPDANPPPGAAALCCARAHSRAREHYNVGDTAARLPGGLPLHALADTHTHTRWHPAPHPPAHPTPTLPLAAAALNSHAPHPTPPHPAHRQPRIGDGHASTELGAPSPPPMARGAPPRAEARGTSGRRQRARPPGPSARRRAPY